MARPKIVQLADKFEVTYSVLKSALPETPKIPDILQSVHRQNIETLSNERQALTADAEIVRLTALKDDKMSVPAETVGP